MKRIRLIIVLFIAALVIPQFAAAQSFPAPAGDIFRQEGIASWYGPEFDGRPTASGEVFDSSMLTAAHPTLPFGTILLVTNRHNNRQVAVRVNDRGPFVASRIVDVSKAAAEQLDMLLTGTAPVLIESIYNGFSSYMPPQDFQPEPPAYTQAPVYTEPPVYSPPAYYDQFYTPPAYTSPPVPQQAPVYSAPPAYTPPPAVQPPPVYTPPPPVQQPPVYTPPPVAVTPSPPESPTPVPYGPVTVTIYPPPQSSPSEQQNTYSMVTVAPQQQASSRPENLPPSVSGARLIPAINPQPGKLYKLQIGSFKIARNAVDVYVRLQNAGLNPEYERHEDFYRVVLKGVQGIEVQSVADKLEKAGFREAVIREE